MKTKDIVKFMGRYLKEDKSLLIKASVFTFIASGLGLLYGILIGEATQSAIDSEFKDAIIYLVIYLLTAVISHLVFRRSANIMFGKLSNSLMNKLNYGMFNKVAMLPAVAFEEKSSGEFINRITNDSSTIANALDSFVQVVMHIITTSVVFVYVLLNSWIISLEIVIYLVINIILTRKYSPLIKESQKAITEEKDKAIAETNEIIRGIREVKALGIRSKMSLSVKKILEDILVKSNKQLTTEHNYNAVTYAISFLLEAVVFITCILLIYYDISDFSFFIAMTYYIYRFMGTTEYIMHFITSYQKMTVSVERIDEIVNNKLYSDEKFGSVNKTDISGHIKLDNIYFRYANEEKEIFKGLNLEIKPNEITALVGKSGQGKSSIFNLLLRYFEPNTGSVLIDNVNINDFTEDAFRSNIAIIRQDPFIFNKTIKENLLLVDDKKSLKDIRSVCKKAQIDEYIMSLPSGYDTVIGEGGVNLSGGQKQRLAIARALLKNSKIILFDEATSALDNENQEKIKNVILELSKDRTIIVIAHRLSTIEGADVIHVVDKGKIKESGKHKDLLKKSDIYKGLYKEEK